MHDSAICTGSIKAVSPNGPIWSPHALQRAVDQVDLEMSQVMGVGGVGKVTTIGAYHDLEGMCGYLAPACVTTSDDLIEFYVKDSSTVDLNAKKGYSARFIRGEVFKMYPRVNCVVQSHAEAVLPYVTSGVPLMSVFHMAGFLGMFTPHCLFTWHKAYVFTRQDVLVYDIEPL
jgi:hypothetical protein